MFSRNRYSVAQSTAEQALLLLFGHWRKESLGPVAGLLRRYLVAPDVEPPFPGSYLAAVTVFTEMVSPLAVPVTLASSHASLLSVSSVAWSEVSRVRF
jgi:hypothetical protein